MLEIQWQQVLLVAAAPPPQAYIEKIITKAEVMTKKIRGEKGRSFMRQVTGNNEARMALEAASLLAE